MKLPMYLATLTVLTALPAALHATSLTPGGPAQTITTSAGVTPNGYYLPPVSGTVTSGTVSASYSEEVLLDGSNPYGGNDLTFLIAIGNGTEPIQGVTLGNFFATVSPVTVGYIVGGGDFGTDIPSSVQEEADGTVVFNFNDTDDIAVGTGTEFLVVQTPATSLPTGDVGIISLVPGPGVAATPEPGSFALLLTGCVAGSLALLRLRAAPGRVSCRT